MRTINDENWRQNVVTVNTNFFKLQHLFMHKIKYYSHHEKHTVTTQKSIWKLLLEAQISYVFPECISSYYFIRTLLQKYEQDIKL
jgi:hypothetical protein